MSTRLTAALALICSTGCMPQGFDAVPTSDRDVALQTVSDLYTDTSAGIAMADHGDVAFVSMRGMTCRYSLEMASTDIDESTTDGVDPVDDGSDTEVVVIDRDGIIVLENERGEEPLPTLSTDLGVGLGSGEEVTWGGQTPWAGSTRVDMPGVVHARTSDAGIVALSLTDTCKVTWVATGVSVPVAKEACLGGEFLVPRSGAEAWLAYGEVAHVDAKGATVLGKGDHVAYESSTDTLLVIDNTAPTALAFDKTVGDQRWAFAPDQRVRRAIGVPSHSAFALLVSEAGVPTVVLMDAATGDLIDRVSLPAWSDLHDLDVSDEGTLVAFSAYFAQFLRVH
ncbi:MAG: hypothetical protein H6733_05015 [Alphaproteobacteria bacterium]|nr:hypothetical protein [Alphaproteobacteria bacterium]